ncbi:toprim domain-containing protein [Xenorhabdus budapestensis]|uniref:Toprim domain-containing protein n=1 Tax=Xenorhabdus budapestensis TaxID=290110 RepID=A0ABX7VMC4_XENBU|nr:primase-helicase zinc-binding domain-containing protein [Xenorhabdus budapestensis]QTL41116.1 toprim domain-containing protein [Xenorhabdus budapestensis]
MVSHIDIRSVKAAAQNQWQGLLSACGVDVPAKGKHGACPICGGNDRFHFIDDHGNGDWHCRQCDNPNHGDGFDLLMKAKGITITEAAKEVSLVLALPLLEPARKEAPKSEAPPIADKVNKLVAQTTIGQSDYLSKKGLQCPNQKLLKDGSLVLVIQALDGTITGAQVIKPSGEKRFVPGSKKKGSFIPLSPITGTPDTIIIAEGYATALTVSQLHEGLVLAALDEGNLSTVAGLVREQWTTAKIILAADNDWHELGELDDKGKPKKNVGKITAEQTAKAIDGWIALPPTEYKADWDDYRQRHGIEAARQAFNEELYLVEETKSMNKAVVIPIEKGKWKKNEDLKPFFDKRYGGLYYIERKQNNSTGEIDEQETWDATKYGLTIEAASRNDGFMPIDEIGQGNDVKHVAGSAYSLFNGTGRIQGNKDGGNRAVLRWAIVALSTGEEDFETYLIRNGVTPKAGQLVRLVSVPFADTVEFHSLDDGDLHSRAIKRASTQHCGAAGRAWIEILAAKQDEASQKVTQKEKEWLESLPDNASPQVKRVATRFAMLDATAELSASITGWDTAECNRFVRDSFNEWMENYGTGNREKYQVVKRARDFIQRYGLNRFQPYTYGKRNGELDRTHAGRIANLAGYLVSGRREDGKDEYHIIPSIFEDEILAGVQKKLGAEALEEAGILIRPESGRVDGKTISINGSQQRFVVLIDNEED